jgi:hypothetical protein
VAIPVAKTKCLAMKCKEICSEIEIDNRAIECVKTFKYLGGTI